MLAKADRPIVKWDFRSYYKKVTKHERDKRLHEYTNDRIIRLFVKKVVDRIINNRSGVHINRIGYFYVHMIPFKLHIKYNGMPHRYQLAFVPTDRSIFKYWGMDFTFNSALKKAVQKRVKEGYRYLNMIKGVSKVDHFYLGVKGLALYQYKKTKESKYYFNYDV